MYWDGVKVDYHWSMNERIIVGTIIEKTFVEFGSPKLRYSLTCNCTPDVAVNRVRGFEREFKKRTGFELLANARVQEKYGGKMNIFMGTVRRDNVVLDLPVIITDSKLFDNINSEIEFQLEYVEKKKGFYSYYDGRSTRFFNSFEELVEAIRGPEHPPVREYFGEDYVQLFPSSNDYFRDYGKFTVYVVNDNSVIITGPGYSITAVRTDGDGPQKILTRVKRMVKGIPAGLVIAGDKIVRGSYYEKHGKYYIKRKVGSTDVDDSVLELYDVLKEYGARGALLGRSESVIVFDDYIVLFMKKAGIVQRVEIKRPKIRLGTLYRYLYFAPQPRGKTYKLPANLSYTFLMYIVTEDINLEYL